MQPQDVHVHQTEVNIQGPAYLVLGGLEGEEPVVGGHAGAVAQQVGRGEVGVGSDDILNWQLFKLGTRLNT